MILDVLLRFGLPISLLRGQTYDGGSNIAGRLTGAQAVIAEKQPLALFVHCLMHAGNLVAAHSIEASSVVRDAVSVVNDLGSLFHHSTKLTATLRSAEFVGRRSVNHLQPLCPRRVLCRGLALQSILHNLDVIRFANEI